MSKGVECPLLCGRIIGRPEHDLLRPGEADLSALAAID